MRTTASPMMVSTRETKKAISSALSPEEYRALLRLDFCSFIERCFYQLNPQTTFHRNWHIEVMAAKLEACRQGRIKRLVINVPPRHLKSLCGSVALPAWLLGHNPAEQVMCVSYAQDLSDKLARECRSVMMSNWYRATFATQLSPQKQSVQEFVTTRQGYRLATSVGGVLTGRGANFIIIDDAMKPNEALSDALRHSVNEWYDNTLYSRLNDKRTGCIILIMQRLHEDDLVGHVLERENWEVVSFPAIAEHEEEHIIDSPFGARRFTRRAGEALHHGREPLTTLGQIRRNLGEYSFASQYLQAPAPLDGGLVKSAWFKTYADTELPERFDQVLQSWDTANKLSEFADYSVCTTWGIKEKRIYLLHVYRRKVNYPDLKRAVRQQAEIHRATVVLIEDKASGTQLIQELVNDGLRIVKPVKPEGDKVMRLNAQTATIENGFVYLPREASWLADFVHELTTFPSSKHDDQADSTSQALAWINQVEPEPGIITFYRMDNARMLHEQGLPLQAIAAQVQATPAQVQDWLSELKSGADEMMEIYEEQFRKRCAKCGGDILTGTSYIDQGGTFYHPECFRKMTRGF
jgi:predicted phage terminase large subunit-like protein